MIDDDEIGKTVLGKHWPLEERAVDRGGFVESYIETGKLSGEKVGFLLGQDSRRYYLTWYLLREEKVLLLHCPVDEFDSPFPAHEARCAMEKNLPEFPVQPIGLSNKHLEQLVAERKIVHPDE